MEHEIALIKSASTPVHVRDWSQNAAHACLFIGMEHMVTPPPCPRPPPQCAAVHKVVCRAVETGWSPSLPPLHLATLCWTSQLGRQISLSDGYGVSPSKPRPIYYSAAGVSCGGSVYVCELVFVCVCSLAGRMVHTLGRWVCDASGCLEELWLEREIISGSRKLNSRDSRRYKETKLRETDGGR